jgi:lincosamide nucleotidyltransferase A/C/D/E
VQLSEVLAVSRTFAEAGVRHWVGGGWGVDALVGRQTRPHRDLDLAVETDRLADVVRLLAGRGYETETDWLPVRLELAGRGERWVDLHPLVFDADGTGRQAGPDGTSFTYPAADLVAGAVAGHPLPCLSIRLQRVFHSGYPLRPVDEADLALLTHLAGSNHRGGPGVALGPAARD